MRSTIRPLALALAACTTACTPVRDGGQEFHTAGAPQLPATPEQLADRHIGATEISRHIAFLAAKDRRGRGSWDEGLERSAAWIADQLHQAGVDPAGDHGGYLQYWGDGGPESANVVGRVPGGDPERDGEYVVLIAHYDHLGVGEPDESGDSIYNGADDNASGVAALLEVARAVGALSSPTRRPLLFLAVSGHERGLAGSTWYADNSTVPLSGAVAVLNLDMVGGNHPDSIGVVGYDRSSLGPLVAEIAAANPQLRLAVRPDPAPADDLFEGSDHFPFARRGIPGIRFFSGSHEHHGTPSDEARHVDDDKVARVARLVFLTTYGIADGL